MEDDAQALEEVVVIGYGTAKKKDLTGAVSTVKGAELAKVPVTNVAEALTGKLAGVQITTTDGSPDAEMIIKVRGGGSITGDNSPLYIVDGFPVSSMGDISPSDIGRYYSVERCSFNCYLWCTRCQWCNFDYYKKC